MAEYTAAQASVLIVPTLGKGANNFNARLRAQLSAVKDPGVEISVRANTAPLIAEVAAVKEALEKGAVNVRVKPLVSPDVAKSLSAELRRAGDSGSKELLKSLSAGYGQAEKDASNAGKRYAAALQESMSGGGTKAAKKLEAEFKQAVATRDALKAFKVNVDAGGARRALAGLRGDFRGVADDLKGGLYLNLKIAGVAQLQQLILLLGSLNASVVELAQSALVLPGIFSGLASSFAAAMVGTRGISDAFKAQAKAQKDAASAAKRQVDANRDVRDATRDLSRAVKDAKRNIEDMNAQLRDAPLDEAEAMLNLQEAQYEASQKLGKSAFEQQKDQLRLVKAESDLAETRRRNIRLGEDVAEANAKGVAGSDGVVAAQERLSKALDDVSSKSDAMSDLADALGKLSPNARAFVESMSAIGGIYSGLRSSVQDRLFENLDRDVQALAVKSLPMLERGLGGIASALNGNVRTAVAALSSDGNQGLLERIFGNTADAQSMFSRAIDPLLNGFLELSAVGSGKLPRLSDAFGDVMRRFEGFVSRAADDGSLDRWIDNGLKALTDLGNSLLNIGSIMTSVADAFTDSGGKGLLELLEDGSKRLADFLKSASGQEKLRDFFRNVRAELREWRPVLETIPGMLRNVAAASQSVAEFLLPFLTTAGQLLRDHPGLVAAVFYAYVGWKSIVPIVSGISAAMDSGLVGALGRVKTAVGTGYRGGGVSGALGALAGMMTPGGIVMTGLTLVAGFLAHQYVTANMEAAEAVRYHKDMVAGLGRELDSVTGSLTQQGLVDQLRRLSNWTNNNLEGNPEFNIPADAEKYLGVGVDQLGRALTPTGQADRDAVIRRSREVLKDELLRGGSDVFSSDVLQKRMRDGNFTIDDLVAALTGDDNAKNRYESLGGAMGPGFTLSDILQGVDSNLPFGLGDMSGISDRGLAASNTARAVMDNTNESLRLGADNRRLSQGLGGKASLKPGGPFDGLGLRNVFWEPDGLGGAVIEVDTPPDRLPEQLRAGIEGKGGTIEPLASGSGSKITLDPDRARLYVEGGPSALTAGVNGTPGLASGGLLSGPGSGVSDSILARVSDGEYVVKAASVAKYGPEFLDQLNAGVLPKFSDGGLNDLLFPVGAGGGSNVTTSSIADVVTGGAASAPKPVVSGPSFAVGAAPGRPGAVPGGGPVAPSSAGVSVPAAPPFSGAHSGGGSPGPGNGVPHLTGAAPGPASFTPYAPTGGGPGGGSRVGGGTENWGIFDFLRPARIAEFLGGMAQNVGSSLLNIGLGFLSGITGFDFQGALAPFMQFGDHVSGLIGSVGKDSDSGPSDANAGVADILGNYPGANSRYVGPSIYGGYDANALSVFGGLGGLPNYMPTGGAPSSAGASAANGNKGFAEQMAAKWRSMGFEVGDHEADDLGEHQNGALDITISDAIGAEPTEAQRARGNQLVQQLLNDPNVYGVIFDNKSYYAGDRAGKDYAGAGATLGHRDHIHVWYQPGRSGNFGPVEGYASGGFLRGPGTGTSDSILARVSHGEFITKASSVNKYGRGFFDQLNAGAIDPAVLPGFADGTPPIQQPLPPPPPATPPPMVPGATSDPAVAGAGVGEQPATDTAMQSVGDALGGIGQAIGGGTGVGSGAGGGGLGPQPADDQRAVLGSAPTNLDHNLSAVSTGINSAASAVGSAIGAAIGAAGAAGGAVAPGAGSAAGVASSMAAGGAQLAGSAINGAVNILSSLLVGTAPGGGSQSSSAYGAPLAPSPAGNPLQQRGPGIVNNYGDIHTGSYEEFYKGQQRRESQQQAALMPMRR